MFLKMPKPMQTNFIIGIAACRSSNSCNIIQLRLGYHCDIWSCPAKIKNWDNLPTS